LREYKHDLETETQLQPPPQTQTYKLKQMQVHQDEEQLVELRQREEAIRQLETDILDVNQIFRELATLVHDQGDTIDSIEANIESSSIRVTQGTEQLRKASGYQTSARKKQCIMFGAGAVILLFLILVIYFTTWFPEAFFLFTQIQDARKQRKYSKFQYVCKFLLGRVIMLLFPLQIIVNLQEYFYRKNLISDFK